MLRSNPKDFNVAYNEPWSVANPGAGNEMAFALDANYLYELLYLRFTFTASAAVATRYITVEYRTALTQLYQAEYNWAPAANEVHHINVAQVAKAYIPARQNNVSHIPWPHRLILRGGNLLTINVGNIQAADTLTNIFLGLNKWHDLTQT